jgi:broad specificity phosphatase PhoE
MLRVFYSLTVIVLLSCKTTTYYVVRHAEKEATNTMTSDVPLSAAGEQRAVALKYELKNDNIKYIFSTNYKRTLTTVEPLRQQNGLQIQLYDTKDTLDRFINRLRGIDNGNVLIVGHSNTVDDIVNKLTGRTEIPGDLPDSAFGDLFVIKKSGNNYTFHKEHFGR